MRFRLFFAILILSVINCFAQNFDARLLASINPNHGESGTWRFVTNNAIPVSIATPFAMFAVGSLSHDENLKKNALHTGFALLANGLITSGIKNSIQRQRPFLSNPGYIHLQGETSGYSFPSGHTSTVFSLATSLSLSYPKWYVIAPTYGFAAATAYSRMYRGAHYPGDVLGGIIVGSGTAFLSWKLQKWFYRNDRIYAKSLQDK